MKTPPGRTMGSLPGEPCRQAPPETGPLSLTTQNKNFFAGRTALSRFFRRTLCMATLVFAGLTVVAGGSVAAEDTIAVICGNLIDGKAPEARGPAVILVRGNKIDQIGTQEIIPENARILDLGEATVLPGLIDSHSHPLIRGGSYQTDFMRRSSAHNALWGLKAARDNLNSGWTTLRIAGDADLYYANQEVREAIEAGWFVGPRISGAGHYMSITGGGGDINFLAAEQAVLADGLIVDGVDEVRRAVREEVKHGSDWIKLLVTGAFMSAGDSPKDVHFSPEELTVAVEEANRLGVHVMAHAHSAEGIVQAVLAGVRSIEHGTFIDDEGIRMMGDHGTFLVPTLYIGDYYLEEKADDPAQQKMVRLLRKYRSEYMANIAKAIRAGIKVALGSDFGGYEPHLNAREFASLVEAGMTPMQAIQAGTRVGAELLGWEDRVGTVEVGKLADLVAVEMNPLEDISELERVIFVMKDGQVIKRP